MINLTLLGATGSIGASTLDVVARHPDKYRLFAVTANTSWEKLIGICRVHRPRYAVLADESAAANLRNELRRHDIGTEVLNGPEMLIDVAGAPEVDYVMAAIVGAAGLPASLAAAKAGKRVLLANKEALVMAGNLFMEAVAESGAELLPIDSEHNAVFQCIPRMNAESLGSLGVARILLTASGGPFLNASQVDLATVSPEQAVAHPNWEMGKKISVDSATMMNKGLEVIEARWLFDAPPEIIEVVVHPQSVVHSMVQYTDGSVLAQLGNPDMRTPIAHALGWPNRIASGVPPLDLLEVGQLTFSKPDLERFPCLQLAYDAVSAGGDRAIVLNAVNEVAVEHFLSGQIGFTDIAKLVAMGLDECPESSVNSIEEVLTVDTQARAAAREKLAAIPFN